MCVHSHRMVHEWGRCMRGGVAYVGALGVGQQSVDSCDLDTL